MTSDAGMTSDDAGMTSDDAGLASDAGTTSDAGMTSDDAGSDSGVTLDAGATPDASVVDAGPSCISRPAGLLSLWHAEQNAADSVGPNNGYLVGGVTYVPGVVGQAFLFNGVDGLMTAPSMGLPTGLSDRSLELWARIDASTPDDSFFAGYGSFGVFNAVYAIGARYQSNQPYFSQWGEVIYRFTPPTSLPNATWIHIAVTTQSGITLLFVNGVLNAAGMPTMNTSAGTSFNVGRVAGSMGSTRHLTGAVDEVAVYGRALTAAEISLLATSPGSFCP